MAGIVHAKADLFRQPYSSISRSMAGMSGTYKRKRATDDSGSLSTSSSDPKITKRQKCVNYCYESTEQSNREEVSEEESSGEESSGLRSDHSLVRQTLCAYDTKADELSFQRCKTALDTNNTTQTSKPSASPRSNKPYSRCSSVSTDKAAPCETSKEPQTARKDTIDLSNRKRHFMYTPDRGMKAKAKKYIRKLYKLFDDLNSEDNCWLHPSPPQACKNGRPPGKIQCQFAWVDSSGKHSLNVNVGIVALAIECQLTEEQMEGYVNEAWHLSHLCGNWTCCNWWHMTVESGRINNSRNQCFPDPTQCSHDPPCMKDRKRRLLVTSAISNRIMSAINSVRDSAGSTVEGHTPIPTIHRFECSLCGEGVLCFESRRICRSLTSIAKSQQALEKLELCYQQSYETLEAITYLKHIIAELIREEKASGTATLESAAAQREMGQSANC